MKNTLRACCQTGSPEDHKEGQVLAQVDLITNSNADREVNVEERCPESSRPYLVGGGRYSLGTAAPRLLLLDLDPRHRS